MNKFESHAVSSGKMVFFTCIFLFFLRSGWAADLGAVVEGLQRRYSSVSTLKASFQQTYRAPGIEQIESGVFWLKKPGLMRWEYRRPEEKLFIADGKESFLYVPRDRQVTIQPFSVSDMHSTPLEFLLGTGEISKSFAVSWESEFKPNSGNAVMLRLAPLKRESEYSFIVLELDRENYELRGIIIRESGGNTSRFAFTDFATNLKVDNKSFKFKTPKGVEEVRFTEDQ
jgi:outer membrane lipoprotein carrier protein